MSLIPNEDVVELLGDQRRVFVLLALRDVDHIELEELSAAVAVREHEAELDQVPAGRIHSIKVSLHHHHLPKLHNARLVEYDARQGHVRRSSEFSSIEEYLDLAMEADE